MRSIRTIYEERFISHDDFKREEIKDIVVYKLNFTRATIKEAQQFRDIVVEDIKSRKLKIIVDLSECDYIDSTFLGALVIIVKKAAEASGGSKICKTQCNSFSVN